MGGRRWETVFKKQYLLEHALQSPKPLLHGRLRIIANQFSAEIIDPALYHLFQYEDIKGCDLLGIHFIDVHTE